MTAGHRMRADMTTTSDPRKQVTFSPNGSSTPIDSNDLYSVSYEWLVCFRDFCRECGGFEVY
jgi:hypothetical protein